MLLLFYPGVPDEMTEPLTWTPVSPQTTSWNNQAPPITNWTPVSEAAGSWS